MISIPGALRLIGIAGGTIGILTVLLATLAYIPGHPDFSVFTTYLSNIGDTPGWPQILFNSGTLIASPLRFLIVALLALRLRQMGAGRLFLTFALIIGFISTFGTILMTAIPFSVAPPIHKSGIGLYFLGVVFLQTLIFFKQWSLKDVPRILPILSILMVVVYLIFFVLIILYEQAGLVSQSTPVIWEWMCVSLGFVWVFAQSILLGAEEREA
jgi:hypothetical membrane protein